MLSDSAEKRDPMTRTERAAPSSNASRRATNVARIVSLTPGIVAIRRRSSAWGMASTSPLSATRAVRYAR